MKALNEKTDIANKTVFNSLKYGLSALSAVLTSAFVIVLETRL